MPRHFMTNYLERCPRISSLALQQRHLTTFLPGRRIWMETGSSDQHAYQTTTDAEDSHVRFLGIDMPAVETVAQIRGRLLLRGPDVHHRVLSSKEACISTQVQLEDLPVCSELVMCSKSSGLQRCLQAPFPPSEVMRVRENFSKLIHSDRCDDFVRGELLHQGLCNRRQRAQLDAAAQQQRPAGIRTAAGTALATPARGPVTAGGGGLLPARPVRPAAARPRHSPPPGASAASSRPPARRRAVAAPEGTAPAAGPGPPGRSPPLLPLAYLARGGSGLPTTRWRAGRGGTAEPPAASPPAWLAPRRPCPRRPRAAAASAPAGRPGRPRSAPLLHALRAPPRVPPPPRSRTRPREAAPRPRSLSSRPSPPLPQLALRRRRGRGRPFPSRPCLRLPCRCPGGAARRCPLLSGGAIPHLRQTRARPAPGTRAAQGRRAAPLRGLGRGGPRVSAASRCLPPRLQAALQHARGVAPVKIWACEESGNAAFPPGTAEAVPWDPAVCVPQIQYHPQPPPITCPCAQLWGKPFPQAASKEGDVQRQRLTPRCRRTGIVLAPRPLLWLFCLGEVFIKLLVLAFREPSIPRMEFVDYLCYLNNFFLKLGNGLIRPWVKLCSTQTAFAARIKSYIPCQESRIVEGIPGLFQCIFASRIIWRILSLVVSTVFLLEYSEDRSSQMAIKLFSLCGETDKHSYMKGKKIEIWRVLQSECKQKASVSKYHDIVEIQQEARIAKYFF